MKKVIILGSTGMLGNEVLMHFLKVDGLDVNSSVRDGRFKINCNFFFDPTVDNVASLPFADFYINAIGIIKPHMLKDLKTSIYINSIFPRELADECEKRDSKLIHITTDCVYSGKDGNYNEYSLHDALDEYGKSKSLGEPENCMVLRTSIIGPEMRNKVSLISWVQDQVGKEINGFTNHLWNGITTLQYAKICEKIINEDLYSNGLYHIHSPNTVNKFELVTIIDYKYKVGARIIPVEAPTAVDRTMSTEKDLCEKLNIPEIMFQIMQL